MKTRNIELQNVAKSFNGEVILKNLNLTIPSGKFFAILGPSGSGKTTLLRLIAGFEKPDEGTIYLGREDLTTSSRKKRKVNTVFQHYALFPHMNVFDNVGYGLKIRGVPKDSIARKVKLILEKVGLTKQINRPVDRLSGGQQQRVALARAIINEPDVLLLDEPLAALDAKLREQMLVELIDLQSELGTTFVYVTHDQSEALTVADYMAIMNQNGEIEQIGTPKEIYEFPKSAFVAQFVGATNILEGVLNLSGETPRVFVNGLGFFEVVVPDKPWAIDGAQVLMSIRPEKIRISEKDLDGFSNFVQGIVKSIVYRGRSTDYIVDVRGTLLRVFEQNEEHFPQEVIDYNDWAILYWQKENVILLKK